MLRTTKSIQTKNFTLSNLRLSAIRTFDQLRFFQSSRLVLLNRPPSDSWFGWHSLQSKFTAESIPKLPTPQPTHNNISCKLEFQGFMPDHLDFYAYFARYSAHALGLPCSPIIHLPTATKRWTIVKGPFVHAKSKENFEQKTHKRSVELFDANEDMREKWIEYVEKNLPDGVDLKIVRFDWVGEGDVKSVIEKAKQEIKEFEESGKKGANVPFHVKVEERAKEFLKHLGS